MASAANENAQRERQASMFKLYNDERKRENELKDTLHEFHVNSTDVLQRKLRCIEKIIDVHVKGQLAKMRAETSLDAPCVTNDELAQMSRARLFNAVGSRLDDIPAETFRNVGLGFLRAFEQMTRQTLEEERASALAVVNAATEEPLGALMKSCRTPRMDAICTKERSRLELLHSILAETSEGADKKVQKKFDDQVARVANSRRRLRRDLGDVASLLLLHPEPIDSSTGRAEGELQVLREKVAKQMHDLEKLTNEKRHSDTEISAARDSLESVLFLAEKQYKEAEAEVAAAEGLTQQAIDNADPDNGKWVKSARELAIKIEDLVTEETSVREQYLTMRKNVTSMVAEKEELERLVEQTRREYNHVAEKRQGCLDKVGGENAQARAHVLTLRAESNALVRAINDMTSAAVSVSYETAKRVQKTRQESHALVARILAEERLQSIVVARNEIVCRDMDSLNVQREERRKRLHQELHSLQEELEKTSVAIQNQLETLVDVLTSRRVQRTGQGDPPEILRSRLATVQSDLQRIEAETARHVGKCHAQTELNGVLATRYLDRLGYLAVIREDLADAGVDPEQSTNDELCSAGADLMTVYASRMLREERARHVNALVQGRLVSRSTVDGVLVRDPTRGATDQNPVSVDASKLPLPEMNATTAEVIQFVKSELQPMYDDELISQRAFVAIALAVSREFLAVSDDLGVPPILTERHKTDIQTLIQVRDFLPL